MTISVRRFFIIFSLFIIFLFTSLYVDESSMKIKSLKNLILGPLGLTSTSKIDSANNLEPNSLFFKYDHGNLSPEEKDLLRINDLVTQMGKTSTKLARLYQRVYGDPKIVKHCMDYSQTSETENLEEFEIDLNDPDYEKKIVEVRKNTLAKLKGYVDNIDKMNQIAENYLIQFQKDYPNFYPDFISTFLRGIQASKENNCYFIEDYKKLVVLEYFGKQNDEF